MRITLRYIAFLLEVFKVFTVLDNYAVILAEKVIALTEAERCV